MYARNTIAVVLALSGLASAQIGSVNLSANCTTALTSILANSGAAACLSLGDVIPVLSLPSNTSVIPSVQTWLGDMCAANPCSNSTLDSVTSTVLTGCQSDIVQYGAVPAGTTLNIPESQQEVEIAYPPTREVACSKSNGAYCLINTLTAVQSLLGTPLSIGTIMSADWVTLASTLNTSSLCTDCNQAAYATLKAQVPSVQGSQVEQTVASRCGSAFVNGGVPSDVTLGSNTGSSASGAAGLRAAVAGMLGGAGVVAALLL
ncbi:hypothetical protein CALCODRAFT_496958 [Calocera cornea HHB12733]|uniref:Uncharacterized protein n=1 Tax=Calocera cornea HHB12733 TaxID=1353952 RepID=A0A165FIH3_9BASI|nr:hypothetical protein CALCODRAFT_496958 [Calocera cornea HHB12733]